MFRGPSFIVSTMQEKTTPIFKRLWYDWTQQQPGIEPTNPLGQCWVPPMVRTYSLQGGSTRSPQLGSPRGLKQKMLQRFAGKCSARHKLKHKIYHLQKQPFLSIPKEQFQARIWKTADVPNPSIGTQNDYSFLFFKYGYLSWTIQ